MVKMILALPKKIKVEELTNLVMDVIKGRYGEGGFCSGLEFSFRTILLPYKSADVYAAGFNTKGKDKSNGKTDQRYYETGADELDPVMISTLEEFLTLIDGADYSFVVNEKILDKYWWIPKRGEFQKWNGRPYYSNTDAQEFSDEYFEELERLDAEFKSPTFLEAFEKYMEKKNAEMKSAEMKKDAPKTPTAQK